LHTTRSIAQIFVGVVFNVSSDFCCASINSAGAIKEVAHHSTPAFAVQLLYVSPIFLDSDQALSSTQVGIGVSFCLLISLSLFYILFFIVPRFLVGSVCCELESL